MIHIIACGPYAMNVGGYDAYHMNLNDYIKQFYENPFLV